MPLYLILALAGLQVHYMKINIYAVKKNIYIVRPIFLFHGKFYYIFIACVSYVSFVNYLILKKLTKFLAKKCHDAYFPYWISGPFFA